MIDLISYARQYYKGENKGERVLDAVFTILYNGVNADTLAYHRDEAFVCLFAYASENEIADLHTRVAELSIVSDTIGVLHTLKVMNTVDAQYVMKTAFIPSKPTDGHWNSIIAKIYIAMKLIDAEELKVNRSVEKKAVGTSKRDEPTTPFRNSNQAVLMKNKFNTGVDCWSTNLGDKFRDTGIRIGTHLNFPSLRYYLKAAIVVPKNSSAIYTVIPAGTPLMPFKNKVPDDTVSLHKVLRNEMNSIYDLVRGYAVLRYDYLGKGLSQPCLVVTGKQVKEADWVIESVENVARYNKSILQRPISDFTNRCSLDIDKLSKYIEW